MYNIEKALQGIINGFKYFNTIRKIVVAPPADCWFDDPASEALDDAYGYLVTNYFWEKYHYDIQDVDWDIISDYFDKCIDTDYSFNLDEFTNFFFTELEAETPYPEELLNDYECVK